MTKISDILINWKDAEASGTPRWYSGQVVPVYLTSLASAQPKQTLAHGRWLGCCKADWIEVPVVAVTRPVITDSVELINIALGKCYVSIDLVNTFS